MPMATARFSIDWPPGFVSRLCTPGDPLCILPNAKAAALAQAVVGAAQARAGGAGWGTGYAGKLSPTSPPVQHLTAQQLQMRRPGRPRKAQQGR